jgi:hypothetical protein
MKMDKTPGCLDCIFEPVKIRGDQAIRTPLSVVNVLKLPQAGFPDAAYWYIYFGIALRNERISEVH